jgi:hypothetical protein
VLLKRCKLSLSGKRSNKKARKRSAISRPLRLPCESRLLKPYLAFSITTKKGIKAKKKQAPSTLLQWSSFALTQCLASFPFVALFDSPCLRLPSFPEVVVSPVCLANSISSSSQWLSRIRLGYANCQVQKEKKRKPTIKKGEGPILIPKKKKP